ncbi:MAG TPA: biosynthetic peptidoglycan transglycosylase [Gemmatimonadales bacterium]|nr:biosynthetic peptidoglycan transglycosylase [Gemmatimonadales bacterium]
MARRLPRAFQAVLLAGGLFVLWLFAVWPPPVWYRTHWPAETAFQAERRRTDAQTHGRTDPDDRARILASWGTAVRPSDRATVRLYHPVPLDSISDWMPQAAMAGEDQRFPDHGGIDWVNLRRALGYPRDQFAWGTARDRRDLGRALSHAWARRAALRGASTITQQLAKNLWFSASRNPFRKVKEAVTAYRLEAALGKDRIMELYLNVAEMGDEIWGVEAASRYYFGRSAAALSATQAATLAGLLPFPRSSNPTFHPGRMEWRERLILRKLQGEPVEVPPVVEEDTLPAPPDTLPPPVIDTTKPIVDSLAPPVDSVGPPTDSTPPLATDSATGAP